MVCDRCDSCGGKKTYENQAMMPLNGKVRCIDWCIHQIVASLNAGGVRTTVCCCGHGVKDGNIVLEDGRVLIIKAKNEPLQNKEKEKQMTEKCKAERHIADDFGDNYATMICQLEKDHDGKHLEQYSDVVVLWDKDDRDIN